MKKIIKALNKKVKNMDVFDIGLTKLAAFSVGVLLVKLFPQLLALSYSYIIILILVLAVRPAYRFFK